MIFGFSLLTINVDVVFCVLFVSVVTVFPTKRPQSTLGLHRNSFSSPRSSPIRIPTTLSVDSLCSQVAYSLEFPFHFLPFLFVGGGPYGLVRARVRA